MGFDTCFDAGLQGHSLCCPGFEEKPPDVAESKGTAPISNSLPPVPELLGGASRWSTGKSFPSALASVPETSRSPSQSVPSCERLPPAHLPAGHWLQCQQPWKLVFQSQLGQTALGLSEAWMGGETRPGLGAPAEAGSAGAPAFV